ncbi:MAG: hypothetical protein ACREQL_07520 [Candidatus Binatia bacterium]
MPSPGTVRILRAAVAAIRPRGHGFDQPIDDDVLAAMIGFFPFLPLPMRLGFPIGLRLLELGPPFVVRRIARFSRLPPDEGRVYLERLHAGGGPLAPLVLGLRTLVLLNFYQHPQALAVLEVDWAGRAATLVRRRAALVEGMKA